MEYIYNFKIMITDEEGQSYINDIEADTMEDAFIVAEEFFEADYPDKIIADIEALNYEEVR